MSWLRAEAKWLINSTDKSFLDWWILSILLFLLLCFYLKSYVISPTELNSFMSGFCRNIFKGSWLSNQLSRFRRGGKLSSPSLRDVICLRRENWYEYPSLGSHLTYKWTKLEFLMKKASKDLKVELSVSKTRIGTVD